MGRKGELQGRNERGQQLAREAMAPSARAGFGKRWEGKRGRTADAAKASATNECATALIVRVLAVRRGEEGAPKNLLTGQEAGEVRRGVGLKAVRARDCMA